MDKPEKLATLGTQDRGGSRISS